MDFQTIDFAVSREEAALYLKEFLLRLLLGLVVVGLAGCLDGSSDGTTVRVLPGVALDFPTDRLTLEYSTDSDDLEISGIALGTTSGSIPDSLDVVINKGDDDEIVETHVNPDTETNTFFYWQTLLSGEAQFLQVGRNAMTARANAATGSTSIGFFAVRGTSYIRETAIQYHAAGDQWYVLDTAKKAVLAITAPAFDNMSNDKVEKTVFSQNGDATATIGFRRPVDFAVDASRNRLLVADRELGGVVAVSLVDGARALVAGIVVGEPVAVEVSGDTAWVIDAADASVHSVDLTTDNSSLLSDAATPNSDEPLQKPIDIVYQPATGSEPNRLFVTDRRPLPTVGDEIVVVNAATGTRELLQPPEVRDNDDEELNNVPEEDRTEPFFTYVALGRMALHGDTLYVNDEFYRGLLAVDVSGVLTGGDSGFGTEGSRQTFSSYLTVDDEGFICNPEISGSVCPGFYNPFLAVNAVALGDDGMGADRLLALDSSLGAVVEIEVDPAEPEALGQRNFLPGARAVPGSQQGDDPIESAQDTDYSAPNFLLANRRIKTAIGVGSSFYAIDADFNALLQLRVNGSNAGTADVLDQLASRDTDGEFDLAETQARALLDARALSYQPERGEFYVVDALSDRVVAVSALGDSARAVASDAAASSISFARPIDSAIYLSGDLDDDDNPLSDQTLVYVLDERSPGNFDIVEVEIDAKPGDTVETIHSGPEILANRDLLAILGGCASMVDPVAMVYYPDPDEMLMGSLLIANRSAQFLHRVDLENATCTDLPFTAPTVGFEIVDIALDVRSNIDLEPALLMLDKSNQQIFRVSLDLTADTATADATPLTGPGQPDNTNLFVSANSLAFDSTAERAYVLDDVLRSIVVVDLAARDPATGERSIGGTVTGQRLVTYRSTALDCDHTLFAGMPNPCDVERE